jgi:hypothetical protein
LFKNLCKCYNISPPSATIIKKEKVKDLSPSKKLKVLQIDHCICNS